MYTRWAQHKWQIDINIWINNSNRSVKPSVFCLVSCFALIILCKILETIPWYIVSVNWFRVVNKMPDNILECFSLFVKMICPLWISVNLWDKWQNFANYYYLLQYFLCDSFGILLFIFEKLELVKMEYWSWQFYSCSTWEYTSLQSLVLVGK